MWSERVSPYESVGPRRSYPPPIAVADRPPIDAVVISHDHYDQAWPDWHMGPERAVRRASW